MNSSSNQLSNSHNQLSQRLQAAVSQPLLQAQEQTVINSENETKPLNESKIPRPPHLPVHQPQAQVPRSTSPSKSASRTKSPGSGKSNGLPAHGWSLSPGLATNTTFHLRKKIIDWPGRQIDDPLSGNLFSSAPPSNSLVSVSNP